MYQDDYELFRQAIVEQDADAWAAIAERYRRLFMRWISRCPSTDASGECYDHLADEALARAWRALSPERFDNFPSLAALLAYLRTCVVATIIDAARHRAAYDRLSQCVEPYGNLVMEEHVLARIERAELWRIAMCVAVSEAERVVLYERFVLDLPPRLILVSHPTLSPCIKAVYSTLRNLCDRLGRDKEFVQHFAEHRENEWRR
jgi:DNA-directed RNA polymerase specialized sigma24 family protein